MSEHRLPMPDNIVWKQNGTPTCVGFACAMAQRVKLYGLTNKWIPLSPYSIYGYYNNSGDGMSIKPGLEALRIWGALPDYEWEKRADNPECAKSLASYRKINPHADESAARFRIRSYRAARGFDTIKSEIDAGNPVVLALRVKSSFGSVNNGYEPIYPRGESSSHAVCVIGYTDDGYMIVKNSWGDPLRNGGIVYVPGKRATSEEYALCDVGTSILPKAKRIEFTIGSSYAIVDEIVHKLDVTPYIKDNRAFLPVRFIAESLGATVNWDASTSTATLNSEEGIVIVRMHDNVVNVNNEIVVLDTEPEIKNNRMMLPIRPIAEALNCKVEWLENENKAVITAI